MAREIEKLCAEIASAEERQCAPANPANEYGNMKRKNVAIVVARVIIFRLIICASIVLIKYPALFLVILSPYEVMRFRDTKGGAIISILIAVYLTYQHFSRTSLQKSLDQGSIVATIAVTFVSLLHLCCLSSELL
ncbi:Cold-regulated inner membrane protein [Arachis hypogaea]|nr:Cold-regulated inner membrane protein [Arachis hypogaea]